MKKVKIDFLNFGEKFQKTDNMFYKILSERYEVEISDSPDYIIYYPFGIEHLKYDCVRIFWTAEQISPDFNVCDYALGYEYMNYGDRYQRHNLILNNYNMLKRLENRSINIAEVKKFKTKFCNFLYGNVNGSYRKEFFELLSKYKKVESCGRLLNNTGYYIGSSEEEKIEWQKNYKFSIAFENVSMPGYTTEKLLHGLVANTVPIYWGNPYVIQDFNKKAFINCNDYNTFDEVIERIIEIDNNDDMFYSMLLEQPLSGKSLNDRKLEVEKFIYHIFDQDLEEAYRRNRGFNCPGTRIFVPINYSIKALDFAFKNKYIGKREVIEVAKKIPRWLTSKREK